MRIGVAGQNAMQAVEQQGWSVLAVVFVTRPGRQACDQIDVEALPRAITGPHDGAQLPGTVGVDLDEIALEIAGFRVSERGFSEADLTRALDPRSNVALRANTGGPAPAETKRMIKDRLEWIEAGEERLAGRRSRVERALGELGEENS